MTPPLDAYRNLPIRQVAAGECVIEQGTKTGRLFILIEGKVEIVKDTEVIVTADRAGDIFGDLSTLLDLPHTTSVRAVCDSRFYVAEDARQFLNQNPPVLMFLCELLARRLVSANDYLVNLKHQFEGHDHFDMIDKVLESLLNRHPRERVPSRSALELTDDPVR
jgi:CRP/FNR family cyclic AMP-dependent transcriptional regulator